MAWHFWVAAFGQVVEVLVELAAAFAPAAEQSPAEVVWSVEESPVEAMAVEVLVGLELGRLGLDMVAPLDSADFDSFVVLADSCPCF